VPVLVVAVAVARGGGGARVSVVPVVGGHPFAAAAVALSAAAAAAVALPAAAAAAVASPVQERVLELDVPVGDPELVAELHRDHQLLEEGAGDGLREPSRDRLLLPGRS